MDESYFKAKRVRGKRGRGVSGKQLVFGMLKRDGKVYTQIVKNCFAGELMPIASLIALLFILIARSFDGLVDYEAYYKVKHSKNKFVNNHINGIENSKGYAMYRLSKFKGIKKENFLLHLKNVNLDIITAKIQESSIIFY